MKIVHSDCGSAPWANHNIESPRIKNQTGAKFYCGFTKKNDPDDRFVPSSVSITFDISFLNESQLKSTKVEKY